MIPEPDDDAGDIFLRGYRMIRRVDRSEAPWPGVLARMPGGDACLLVDAELLGRDWRGWDARPDGHLLAPIDVLRRADGHDVALPVCVESVETFLARRNAVGAALSDGEILTLAVSVMRGAAECAEHAARAATAGQWWLAEGGRPVFVAGAAPHTTVPDDAEHSVTARTVAVLQTLEDSASRELRPVLSEAARIAAEPRTIGRSIERWEAGAFESVSPLPLATTILAPVRARRADPLVVKGSDDAGESRVERGGGVLARWARHWDEDLADAVSQIVTRVWRRFRARGAGSRRRPWAVAAAIAVAVVGVGVMWPGGDTGTATADGSSASPASQSPNAGGAVRQSDPPKASASEASSQEDTTIADAPPETLPPTVDGDIGDWVRATEELLSVRAACGTQDACLSEVMEQGPNGSSSAGAADLAPEQRTTTLIEAFGGAAVLRVDDATGASPSQLVVIVRVDDRFLLRAIHDVAKQEG